MGLIVQGNMNWNEHVANVVKKAGKRLYMLRVLQKPNADTKTLICVDTTFIRLVLENACQVWHLTSKSDLSDDIEQIQRRAFQLSFRFHLSVTEKRGILLVSLCQKQGEKHYANNFSKRIRIMIN